MKLAKVILTNLVILFVFSSFGLALNVNNNNYALLAGTPVTITGTVMSVPWPASQGLQIDTGQEVIVVYGLGPRWYWNQEKMAYPVIGEQITVQGYEVTFPNGSKRIIATKVSFQNGSIQLRDENGWPLWNARRNLNRSWCTCPRCE